MEKFIEEVFAPGGLLSCHLKDFEARGAQREMAETIFNAYADQKISLIEAGTGTGKSWAYLIPAIFWARFAKEKIVISTQTIALQEQLLLKDIPLLLRVLGVELKAVLVKGMSNYLCLKKLSEVGEEGKEMSTLREWAQETEEGSRTELAFAVTHSSWEKVNVDPHTCVGPKCSFYKECFFFKARKEVEEAQLLVVNHHLLFTDLTIKQTAVEKTPLPPYRHLVIDEAHSFEEIGLECLSRKADRMGLIKLLGKVESGLSDTLTVQKRDLIEEVTRVFVGIELSALKEERYRLKKESCMPDLVTLGAGLKKFATALGLKHKEHGLLAVDLENKGVFLEEFGAAQSSSAVVRWMEKKASTTTIVMAQLDISEYLRTALFETLTSATLCSATLAASGSFDFVKQRLGFKADDKRVEEKIYASPFDYANRALLAVPIDLPLPNDPAFYPEAIDVVSRCLEISRGNAFVLFTSYEMLSLFYEALLPFAELRGFSLLRQGQASRQHLIDTFKKTEGSILLGTDSFWEGVDVAGEALRCLIIAKLPFRVPSDPLLEAQAELLTAQGKVPFVELALPQAALKFKQGFGRLIRTQSDRGCIVCLDKRLTSKNYGKVFLSSLPACPMVFADREEVLKQMAAFYRRTG